MLARTEPPRSVFFYGLFPRFNGLLSPAAETDTGGHVVAFWFFVMAAISWVVSVLLREN